MNEDDDNNDNNTISRRQLQYWYHYYYILHLSKPYTDGHRWDSNIKINILLYSINIVIIIAVLVIVATDQITDLLLVNQPQ